MENFVKDTTDAKKATAAQKIQRPQDVVYVHVYRGDFTNAKPSEEDMSALVITGTGEVYGTGWNTLVGWKGQSPMLMEEDGPGVLVEYVKVEALSGLGLKKIVVGLGFGAALTLDNHMYFWNRERGRLFVPDDAIVMVHEYRQGPCHCGNSEGGACDRQSGVELFKCPHSDTPGYYKTYTTISPPPLGVPVKMFIKFASITQQSPRCTNCERICTSNSFPHDLCKYKLYFCKPCNFFRQLQIGETLSSIKSPQIQRTSIVDMDCGQTYVCYLAESNQLTFWSWKNHAEYLIPVRTPDIVNFKTLYCGRRHFAVISGSGRLYMFGNGAGESVDSVSNGTEQHIALRRVSTPAPVEKVCCGDQVTVCLLSDRSVWCFGSESSLKLSKESGWELKDIAGYHCLNTFFLNGNSQVARSIDGQFGTVNWKFLISNKDCNRCLMDNIGPRDVSARPKSDHARNPPPCWRSSMFGNNLLSDITLRLSDGEFFAHRIVLFGSSNYFKNIITNQRTISTLDMTSYNPRAYKVLLQYFYKVLPDSLDLPGLLDLFSIAISYKEPAVVDDVAAKLMSLIRVDNVLQILVKAKDSGHQALIRECEIVIHSPHFKDKIAASLFSDPSKFLELAEAEAL